MNEPFSNHEQCLTTEEEPIPEEYKDHRIQNKNNIFQNKEENLKPNLVITTNPQVNNIASINQSQDKNNMINNKNINNNTNNTTINNNNFVYEKSNPTNNNITNNNISGSRATKSKSSLINFDTSKFDNYNIEKMRYDLIKDYSYLHINKDEEFLNRMQFDIYKRQLREDRIDKLVEQNKVKIDEDERIKAFNRLIIDANRRIEAQENMENIKNKLEEDLAVGSKKKYSDEEWKEIYNKRFKNYVDNINKKKEENMKLNMIKKINDENEQIKLCKTKKASQKHIDKEAQRMYDEAKRRKIKMDEKLRNLNNYNFEDDDPRKYVKKINSEAYSFVDDEEDFNNINNIERGTYNNYYIGPKKFNNYNNKKSGQMKKTKGMAVSEFNNKRFDQRPRMGRSCSNIINNKNRNTYNNNKYIQKNSNDFLINNNLENNNEYNLEEERNKLIQMANSKSYKQIPKNNFNNKININNKNKFKYNYNKDSPTSGVSDIVDQFFLRNIKGGNSN